MNREKPRSLLWNWIIAAALGIGGAGSLATAFGLDFTVGTLLPILLFTGFFCFCGSFRRGFWPCLAATALFLLLFWKRLELPLQVEALAHYISRFYSSAYGWPTVSWSGQWLSNVPKDNAIAAIGCLVGLYAAFCVSRGRSSIPAALVAILPLAACIVVTDTVPESRFLFLFLFGLLLLVLTQSLRRRDPARSNRLAMGLCLPLLLALALLFQLVPQDGYTPPPEDLDDQIVSWFQSLATGDLFSGWFPGSKDDVNLEAVGPKAKQRTVIMEVTSFESGPLYLRGQAFDTYDGTSWSRSALAWRSDSDYPTGRKLGQIHIVTHTVHDVLYTPYNPEESYLDAMERGQVANTEKLREYDMIQWAPSANYFSGATGISQSAMSQYLQLPVDTLDWALDYLDQNLELGKTESNDATVEAIGALVRDSAEYSLQTPYMSSEYGDFVQWFLEDSDTGYCTHFASAAAVLLRAAGIPARYVTGYLVDAKANTAVTVRASDAHAWVEYWLPNHGWQVLEATPSGGGSPITPETEPAQPDVPDETTVPDETEPSETRPSATTPSGGSDQAPDRVKIDLSGVWKVLRSVFLTALILALILGQRILRLRLREKLRTAGSSNAQALFRWRETGYLCRLLRTEPPRELLVLAKKAKFSQHEISAGELARFETYRAAATLRLRQAGWYLQPVYRLILALY